MKILFKFTATIEVPDAEHFLPKKMVEQMMIDLFEEQGMITRKLEITKYGVAANE